jgi:hypothetical protein
MGSKISGFKPYYFVFVVNSIDIFANGNVLPPAPTDSFSNTEELSIDTSFEKSLDYMDIKNLEFSLAISMQQIGLELVPQLTLVCGNRILQ